VAEEPAAPAASATPSTSSTLSTPPTDDLTPNLPADTRYTIQVYALRDATAAARAAAELQADGFTAFTRPVDLAEKGIWHRVFINGYPSLEAARTALEQLDQSRFPDAYVRRLPPDIRPGAAAAPPPAAADSFPYAYQVASRREADQALHVAEDLAARGFTAYLGSARLPDGALWHHVFAGAFATLEEGRPLGEQLARAGYAEAFPVALPFTLLVRRTDAGAEVAEVHVRLKSLGHMAYRLPGDGDDVWRIGGFQERGDAEEARRRLVEAGVAAEVVAR
jgi:cell division septation protein DedD